VQGFQNDVAHLYELEGSRNAASGTDIRRGSADAEAKQIKLGLEL